MGTLQNFARWLTSKTLAAALILVLGLPAGALGLFLRDNVDFDQARAELVRTLTGERAKVQSALSEVRIRLDRLSTDAAAEQAKAKQADAVIAQLKELESTWDRLVGNPDQQKANTEQMMRMQALRTDALARAEKSKQEYTRTTWERDGQEITLGKITARLNEAEAKKSKVQYYLEKAWRYRWGYCEVRTWVIVGLVLYFFGPTAWKIVSCFFRPKQKLAGRGAAGAS